MTLFRQLKLPLSSPLAEGLAIGWLISLGLFLVGLHSRGWESDLNFWLSWIIQLDRDGYRTITANYPPLILHWLYLGSNTLGATLHSVASTFLAKFWIQIPVWLAWMLLINQVATTLLRRGISPISSWVFWLTICNPALLLDGPMWGQVDLIPWLFVSLGLYSSLKDQPTRSAAYFTLAVCTKFQSIAFAPVFAALWIKSVIKTRHAIWAIPASILTFFLTFLPFILAGRGFEQIQKAYWKNIGLQPAATNNAANLWYSVSRNSTLLSDTPLLSSPDWLWLNPKFLGLGLFAIFSLFIFISSLRNESFPWSQCTASIFAFFAFCPEMHERYLLMAVPVSAVWAASRADGGPWYALSTAIVAINIMFIYFPSSDYEWRFVSFLTSLGALALLIKSMGAPIFSRKMLVVDKFPRVVTAACIISPFLLLKSYIPQNEWNEISSIQAGSRFDLAHTLSSRYRQSWGKPIYQINKTPNSFGFNDRTILSGIKVHAQSILEYDIPPGKFTAIGRCGPEKIANARSQMRFQIAVNDSTLWESRSKKGRESSDLFEINFYGPGTLKFILDPEGTNFGDHGLWGDVSISRTE